MKSSPARRCARSASRSARCRGARSGHATFDDSVERDLVFLGLVGMIDPPREEAQKAVAQDRGAAIRRQRPGFFPHQFVGAAERSTSGAPLVSASIRSGRSASL